MRTCCSTRDRSPDWSSRPVRSAACAILAFLLACSLVSCSDDIVCPTNTMVIAPSIAGSVLESRLADGDSTVVRVRCLADPLPDEFVVFVSGRELDRVDLISPITLVASLDDDDIVWQHGQGCSLRVNTETGLSTATEDVPGGFSVRQPAEIALGETLRVTWTPSEGADYYDVRCVVSATGDSLVLERSVPDTVVMFGPDEVTLAGTVAGWVRATAGPFPDGGTDGNVSGVGWGYFTVSYYDSLCLFESAVTAR